MTEPQNAMLNSNYWDANDLIMTWLLSLLLLIIYFTFMNQIVFGQKEVVVLDDNFQSITSNDTTAKQIVEGLERIIEQNNGSSRNSLLSSYVGMMSFLVGLALVIFGLQLSRGQKATRTANLAYKVLILALILPVVGLYTFAWIRVDMGEVKNEYLGVASLLMIPSGAVLVIMAFRLHEKL
ncbi:MAG: hypothetical protein WBX01_01780 [Nitrososphaeraceae archaeon]|jgi:hypothetical protein